MSATQHGAAERADAGSDSTIAAARESTVVLGLHARIRRRPERPTASVAGIRTALLDRPTCLARVPMDGPATRSSADAENEELESEWCSPFLAPVSGPEALDLVVEVVHDLRSPLTAIVMLAETLLRNLAATAPPAQRRQLSLIYGASLGMSAVTSDVIELARGGDRLMERDPEPFSIAALIESVRSIVAPIAEERGIELRTVIATHDQRAGHRMALGRVLLNLTTNALRFTDTGFVEIAATTITDDRVALSVRDTGPGIPTEALATLCQPFRRTRNRRSHSVSESGLGLTICSKLVRSMRSELQVETRPGWGTRMFFEVDLPESSNGQAP